MSSMTFGVNTLDWSNIGRTLQTHLAETFRNETVGNALVETNLAAFSSMIGFPIYDGETGAKSTQYDMYIDRDEVDEGLATPSAEYAITTKENEDGEKIVIDRTLIPNFYIGSDADGNLLITQDVSLLTDDSISYDDDGTPIPWNVSGVGGIQAQMGEVPIQEWADDLFNSIIDTDTGWAPDHMLTVDGATTGNSYQEVDSVANSDTTAWVRLRARNGLESIYFSIPMTSMTEQADYESFLDTLPETFTFDDTTFFYPHGTVVELDTPATAAASTVEATSLASTMLSSTYETSLDNLKTDYEAVLSRTYVGGSGGISDIFPNGWFGGSGGGGGTDCPDNATYNTTDAKCECNDDGTWKGAYTLKGSECVPGFGMIISSKITNGKSLVEENKLIVAGTAVVLLGGLVWTSGMFRDSQKTQGQVLGMKVRTTKKGI